jgi:hypothetical protein
MDDEINLKVYRAVTQGFLEGLQITTKPSTGLSILQSQI